MAVNRRDTLRWVTPKAVFRITASSVCVMAPSSSASNIWRPWQEMQMSPIKPHGISLWQGWWIRSLLNCSNVSFLWSNSGTMNNKPLVNTSGFKACFNNSGKQFKRKPDHESRSSHVCFHALSLTNSHTNIPLLHISSDVKVLLWAWTEGNDERKQCKCLPHDGSNLSPTEDRTA